MEYNKRSGLYTNRSEITQLDSLVNEIFMIFSNIEKFMNKEVNEENEDSLDLSIENRDRVGYLFTTDKLKFGDSIAKGDAISERIRQGKDKNQQLLKKEIQKKHRITTSSINMTSTILSSKVSLNISNFISDFFFE